MKPQLTCNEDNDDDDQPTFSVNHHIGIIPQASIYSNVAVKLVSIYPEGNLSFPLLRAASFSSPSALMKKISKRRHEELFLLQATAYSKSPHFMHVVVSFLLFLVTPVECSETKTFLGATHIAFSS